LPRYAAASAKAYAGRLELAAIVFENLFETIVSGKV